MPDQVKSGVILSAREASEGEGPKLWLSELHRPQATGALPNWSTHCSHFGVVPVPPLWLAGLHPPRVQSRNRKWARNPRSRERPPPSALPSDPRPTTRGRPCPSPECYRPLPRFPAPRTREIMSNMESILSDGRGATGGPWGPEEGEARGGGHAQGLDLFAPRVEWGRSSADGWALAAGFGFFSPLFFSFLLLAAASAAAAILECGEGQGSLWTEGDNWAHTASCWGLLSPALSVNFGIFEMDKAWCQNRGGGWSLSTLLGGDVGFECTTWTNSFWQAALFWMQVTGDEVEQFLGALGTNYACFLIQLRANLTLEET